MVICVNGNGICIGQCKGNSSDFSCFYSQCYFVARYEFRLIVCYSR